MANTAKTTSTEKSFEEQFQDELTALRAVPGEDKPNPYQIERKDRIRRASEEIATFTEHIDYWTDGTENSASLLSALRNLRIAKEKLIAAIQAVPDGMVELGGQITAPTDDF